jgi:hypothetical protein
MASARMVFTHKHSSDGLVFAIRKSSFQRIQVHSLSGRRRQIRR